MKITSREWARLPDSFKSVTDGQRSILVYEVGRGTCSVPVEIDDEHGEEEAIYQFDIRGTRLTFSIRAYTLEDAMAYAVQDGHPRHRIENMRRVRSLCDPE